MKKNTKFLLHLTSMATVVSIATLNISQFAVLGRPKINVDSQPDNTQPGGPRFVEPPEDIGLPDRQGRTVRGGCASRPELSLTALVPKNKVGRTVSDYPTFFFYLPETETQLAEFILEDRSGTQIYKQTLTISNLSGTIGISIPTNKNVPPLEVGKSYSWSFSVICDTEDRSADVFEKGIVRRVELSADIRSQLEKADPRQKTFIYAENGIWQDALSTLAAARRAQPNDAVLKTDWESLLDSVTLGKIAKEPIVPIDPQPIAPIDPKP
ncbi:MAG: DUF928 domain-containing protein [Oscillatoriales cyanobacterium]|nr:MAG: DUF928 domain-containing protein [Oscillatoriales cyanobacterium]TAH15036.1 MAG: DUF928 domain-containing protein [Oscillatoriales cyanobacterium]